MLMNTSIHLIGPMKKKLPTKNYFYSLLNDEHISDTQHVHAIKVITTEQLQFFLRNDHLNKAGHNSKTI